MKNGFVITAIKKNGLREMAFDNNHRNTYLNITEAEKKLKYIVDNNSEEQIQNLIGKDLRIDPTILYDSGDSTRTVFEDNTNRLTDEGLIPETGS